MRPATNVMFTISTEKAEGAGSPALSITRDRRAYELTERGSPNGPSEKVIIIITKSSCYAAICRNASVDIPAHDTSIVHHSEIPALWPAAMFPPIQRLQENTLHTYRDKETRKKKSVVLGCSDADVLPTLTRRNPAVGGLIGTPRPLYSQYKGKWWTRAVRPSREIPVATWE